jgi:hypothetical protein
MRRSLRTIILRDAINLIRPRHAYVKTENLQINNEQNTLHPHAILFYDT